MSYQISAEAVCRVMTPVLGERFTHGTGLDDQVAQVLCSYQPRREDRSVFLARLKDRIFGGIYDYLGSAMLLQLEDGRVRRVLLEDIDRLTDLLSGLLLMTLPGSEVSMEELRQRAMLGGSLGAMQALLRRYGDSLPELERAMLTRILVENGVHM